MEKITLTRREAAELLGISTSTVTQWVVEGRLKAYRVSNRPKSPYLFTREDCLAALAAIEVKPRQDSIKATCSKEAVLPLRRQNDAVKELEALLKVRTKGRGR